MKSIFLLLVGLTLSFGLYSQSKPKVALVLSGGGAKGIAHIGVIRVLESRGIKPDMILGTSMGSLVGGLYALGYTPDQMEDFVGNANWDFLLNDMVPRENFKTGQGIKDKNTLLSLPLNGIKPLMVSGMYGGQNVLTIIEILTRNYNRPMDFDSFPTPFRCIGTNIEDGSMMVFESGRISDAMRASMSIPSVFAPYPINGQLYVDGGLVNNFPTDIAKQMGADIIIGVDVGAELYKKEEITSVLQILDQTASFNNARVAEKNKTFCDIYIRPDISGISALAFDETDSIVSRGFVAAKNALPSIDSVFSRYNLTPILDTTPRNTEIKIEDISIKMQSIHVKHHKPAKKMALGKLGFETPSTISESQLSNNVNRLFGSAYFEDISLTFFPTDTAFNLEVALKEKQTDDFGIGMRYDFVYGVNVLIKANFRNLLHYGSLSELSAIVGQAPQVRVRFTTDNGKKISLGTSFNWDNFNAYGYLNHKNIGKYNFSRYYWDVFAHTIIRNNNRIILGVEYSMFGISSSDFLTELDKTYMPYISGYLSYIRDSYDNAYFPTKGTKHKFRTDLIVQEDGSILSTAWFRKENAFKLSKKWVLKSNLFLGIGSQGVDTTLFVYWTGGVSQNRVAWYNSFPGLRHLEVGKRNIALLSLTPRWNFYGRHYLSMEVAATILDNKTQQMVVNPELFYAGFNFKYSYNSMLGPLEISADYSPQFNAWDYFISLGYWF
jgi:NTE family protein